MQKHTGQRMADESEISYMAPIWSEKQLTTGVCLTCRQICVFSLYSAGASGQISWSLPGIEIFQLNHRMPYDGAISEDVCHDLFVGIGRNETLMQKFFTGRCKNLLAEWLRHRYRMIIRKQWKPAKTKMRNLRKLGIDKEKARQAANTSHGPFWATSHSTVNFAVTNQRLKAAGCYDIEAACNQMHSSY